MDVTVAQYLKQRLEEQGLDRLFGVAGNYSAPLLDTILEDPGSPIKITGNPSELCAGYAADGYARLKGIGAVCVTYGVGSFSLLNPIAGSYVESVPVVVIIGAPTYEQRQQQQHIGLLYSHMTGDEYSNINAYRPVTAAAERIQNARLAPQQIDNAILSCITEKRPVFIEVFEDVWRQPCAAPEGRLEPLPRLAYNQRHVDSAVEAVTRMIMENGCPIFWAGIELHRQGLQDQFLQLVETTGIPFVTSILGKSVVSEDHPDFRGVFNGNASPKEVGELFRNAGCRIALGVWTTSKNLGGNDDVVWNDTTALAARDGVVVGTDYYPSVALGDFITTLRRRLLTEKASMAHYRVQKAPLPPKPSSLDEPLTYDGLFGAINHWLTDQHIVVVDAGFPLLGAQSLHVGQRNGFVAQAAWLAIGWSVPAAVGVKCAEPGRRPIVFVGDGAFQETCQALSDHHSLPTNSVVFVLDNGIYGIEQMLVNPNPFRHPPVDYPERTLNTVYTYNDMPAWNYEKMADVFGGLGRVANTQGDLETVLEEINERPEDNFIVHVKLPKTDIPTSISYRLDGVGEDETDNPGWPPF